MAHWFQNVGLFGSCLSYCKSTGTLSKRATVRNKVAAGTTFQLPAPWQADVSLFVFISTK